MKYTISTCILLGASLLTAKTQFHPPILLSSEDGPACSENPGYASPCLADVDADGKDELLIGQFAGGNIAIYEINKLTAEKNQLGKKRWLTIDGKRAEVPGVW